MPDKHQISNRNVHSPGKGVGVSLEIATLAAFKFVLGLCKFKSIGVL